MTFNSCELYALPIDNTYTNVFDWSSGYLVDIYNILNSNYSHYRVETGSTRSIKNYTNDATVTIPIAYEIARKFNYICLFTFAGDAPDKLVYYFITDWISENDSISAPSTTLKLQYDVWTNNYQYMIQNNYNHIQHTSCRHIQRYKKIHPSQTDSDYTFSTDFVRTDEGFPQVTSSVYSVDINQPLYKHQVAWLRVTLKPVAGSYYRVSNTSKIINSYYPPTVGYTLKDYNSYGVQIFRPAYIIENGNKKSKYNFEWCCRMYNDEGELTYTSWIENNRSYNELTGYSVDDIYESFISSADITFNPPFDYSVDLFEKDGKLINRITAEGYGANIISITILEGNVSAVASYYIGGNYKAPDLIQYNKRYSHLLFTRENLIAINEDFKYKFEPFYNFYPFIYEYLLIGDKKIPITFNSVGGHLKITVEPHATCTNFYLDIYDNNFNYLKDRNLITIKSNGNVPYSINSFENYLAFNSNRFNTELLNKMISANFNIISNSLYAGIHMSRGAIPRTLTQAGETAVNAYSFLSNRDAFVKDLSTSPETENIPSSISQDSEYIQDNILIYQNVVDTDTISFKSICEKIKRYGYNINSDSDIIKNTRLLFDYVKTDSCSLPTIPNTYDRKQLEGIFNSGVRRWHIENFKEYGTYTIQAQNLNYNLTNPDINVWNNE